MHKGHKITLWKSRGGGGREYVYGSYIRGDHKKSSFSAANKRAVLVFLTAEIDRYWSNPKIERPEYRGLEYDEWLAAVSKNVRLAEGR